MTASGNAVKQIIDLLKQDLRHETIYFYKDPEPKIFNDLVTAGFFAPEKVPSLNRKPDGSYVYINWPQARYLINMAVLARQGKLNVSTTQSLIEVLRKLYPLTENVVIGADIFKAVCNIPVSSLEVDDIKSIFRFFPLNYNSDVLSEMAVYAGFELLADSCANNSHDIQIFGQFCRLMLMSRVVNEKSSNNGDLRFFGRTQLRDIFDEHLDLDELFNSKKFIIKEIAESLVESIRSDMQLDSIRDAGFVERPAIEKHSQNKFHFEPISTHVEFLYILMKFTGEKGSFLIDIANWKQDPSSILFRFYLCLATEFPNLISLSESFTCISIYNFNSFSRHEMYEYLKKNFNSFSAEQQNAVLEKIQNIVVETDGYSEEETVMYKNREMLRWLQAIKNSGNAEVESSYQRVRGLVGGDLEHPDFSMYMGATWVGPTSPLKKQDFEKYTIEELFVYLRDYKEEKTFAAPSRDGLARALEDYVSEDPLKSSGLIDKMDSLDFEYGSHILSGFTKAFEDKKYVPVPKLLSKSIQILSDSNFRTRYAANDRNVSWFVSSIFRFIVAGVRDDEHAFEFGENTKCWEILNKASEFVISLERFNGHWDGYSRAINEPRGKFFEAAIILALREARVGEGADAAKQSAFSKLQLLIEPPLDAPNDSEISLYAMLGVYYRQISYLDKDWIYSNFEKIIPADPRHEELWLAFMEGFGYVAAYVREMFEKLWNRGDLMRFLQHEIADEDKSKKFERLQDRVIELGLISFVLGDQTLENGVICKVIENKNEHEWNKLVWSLSSIIGKDPTPEHRQRGRDLFMAMVEKFSSETDLDKLRKYFLGVAGMLDLSDDPDSNFAKTVVKFSSQISEGGWSLGDVIDYFYENIDSKPESIGKLFKVCVDNASYPPTYPEEKIKEIGQKLKNAGFLELLASIVYKYDEVIFVGSHPLKDLS